MAQPFFPCEVSLSPMLEIPASLPSQEPCILIPSLSSTHLSLPVCLFHEYLALSHLKLGFPGGSDGKESACNMGNTGLIPGSGRSPGKGNSNILQYPLPGEFYGQEPGRLQSMGSQRIRHDWVTNTFILSQTREPFLNSTSPLRHCSFCFTWYFLKDIFLFQLFLSHSSGFPAASWTKWLLLRWPITSVSLNPWAFTLIYKNIQQCNLLIETSLFIIDYLLFCQ